MYYSHELLTSRQYGVATVWLVATSARNSMRRVSRKAILDVDLPKACGVIVDPPGAPMALRLQGNLLYGVSRVYQHQCGYVLTDCEKTQTNMERFFVVGSNNLDIDVSANKAKRRQLILLDDPDFVLDFQLPALDLDFADNVAMNTQKTSSQFSPAESGSRSLSSGGDSLPGLQIRRSSTLSSPSVDGMFADASLPGIKHNANDIMFEDDELIMGGLGLAIDADGNIIEEPDLPDLNLQPAFGGIDDALGVQLQQPQQEIEDGPLLFDGEGDVMLAPAEEVAAEAGAAPAQLGEEVFEIEEEAEEQSAPLVVKKTRKPKKVKLLEADSYTQITSNQLKAWNNNYIENMEQATKRHHTTPAEAKQNAWNWTYGWGVGHIGMPSKVPGLVHPLAELYAGKALKAALLGYDEDEDDEAQRGRRRTSSEMREDEEDEDAERRVRPRLDEDGEIGLGLSQDNGDELMFDGEPDIEIGREAQQHMSDQPSLPWNRQSSLIPSSAAKGSIRPGLPGSNRPGFESSPLVGRGSALRDIERYSDNVASSDDGGFGAQHQDFSDNNYGDFTQGEGSRGDTQVSQAMRDALDSDGRNFLVFVERIAAKKGVIRGDNNNKEEVPLRWIGFNDLFEDGDETRAVAAQAFYQVLSLVTKKALHVEQEGDDKTPFGNIHIGVRVLMNFDFEERAGGEENQEQDSSAIDGQEEVFEDAEEYLEE